MPLACCVGVGPVELYESCSGYSPMVAPRNVALVGVRDIDQLEAPHVRKSGVVAFTMRDIDERGYDGCDEKTRSGSSRRQQRAFISRSTWTTSIRTSAGVGTPVRAAARTARRTWDGADLRFR